MDIKKTMKQSKTEKLEKEKNTSATEKVAEKKEETVEERLVRIKHESMIYKPLPSREEESKDARKAWALQLQRKKEEEARLEAERKKHEKPEHQKRLDEINGHLERLNSMLPNSLRDAPEQRESIISLLETMKYVLSIIDPHKSAEEG